MSMKSSGWAFLGTSVVVCSLVMTLGAPSSARIVERGTFHDEFSGTD